MSDNGEASGGMVAQFGDLLFFCFYFFVFLNVRLDFFTAFNGGFTKAGFILFFLLLGINLEFSTVFVCRIF